MFLYYLLCAFGGAIIGVAVYILVYKLISKGQADALIEKAKLEAENIRQQKELQAARRKKENALKKLEEEIEQLETRDSELDELMALPENAVNVAKCVELSREKDEIAANLETLYDQWESLSEEE